MIITDKSKLEIRSELTTVKECMDMLLFERLEDHLNRSTIPGYGLAAIQIDVPLRAFLLKINNCLFMVINPVIINEEDPILWTGEGCLSDPGKYYNTTRYSKVEVEYTEYLSGITRKRKAVGIEAVCWQHEIDHCNGVLHYKREYKQPPKIGRNDLCLCGSGLKYKKCCLK